MKRGGRRKLKRPLRIVFPIEFYDVKTGEILLHGEIKIAKTSTAKGLASIFDALFRIANADLRYRMPRKKLLDEISF